MGSYVYGLIDNQTSELFYVGVTVNPKMRMMHHRLKKSAIGANGFRMEILEDSDDEMFWMQYMISLGCNLVNVAGNRHNRKVKVATLREPLRRFTFEVPTSLKDRLNQVAKATGVSTPSFIRHAIYKELDRVAQAKGAK